MSDFYSEATRPVRHEYLRLLSVEIECPTDEQIAKLKESRADALPQANIKTTWEPLSYRIEGGRYGNTQADYIQITMGRGLDDEELAAARAGFWKGLPSNKRLSVPSSLGVANRRGERWLFHAKQSGLRLTVEENGQLSSPDVGQVFEVTEGYDVFPVWDPTVGTRGAWSRPDKGEKGEPKFMRYPVAKATDYVAPADVPVRQIQSNDEAGTPTAAATTSGGGGVTGVTKEQLAAAFAEIGMNGMAVDDLTGAGAQMAFVNKNGGRAPVLFAKEIQDAAAAGALLNLGVDKGAIVVDNGVVAVVA